MALIRLKQEIDRILSRQYHADTTLNKLIQSQKIEQAIQSFDAGLQ